MATGWHVLGLAALAVMATGATQAADQVFTSTGNGLAVVQACARHVSVSVDPALSGQVSVTAQAEHPEEIAQLAVATVAGQARVGLRPDLHECWTPRPQGSFDRTLVLLVRVPTTFPVSVTEDGLGDYALGAVGPLTLSTSGKVQMVADTVNGDTRLNVSGMASIEIRQIDANRLDADLSGAGSLHIAAGRIGTVKLSESGATRVRIDPVVDTAALASSGIGSIQMGGVRGALSRASSGLGRITVAGRPAAVEGDD